MSDTPDTDAAWADWTYAGPGVHANFARKLERERDEARKSLEFQTKLSKEVIEREKQTHKECDELRAEVERLKAERDNWRVSSVCRELNAELERLKADKARMDWLAALDCDSPLWDALSDTTKLRSTIDAAMKGAE